MSGVRKEMIEFVDLMQGCSFGGRYDRLDEFWYSVKWVMEPIHQGKRAQCLIDEKGNVRFSGAEKKNFEFSYKVKTLINEIKNLEFPKNTLFDGYLSIKNDFNLTLTYFSLLSDEKRIDFLQEHGEIVFYISDIIYLDEKNKTQDLLLSRKRLLEQTIKASEHVKIQECYYSNKDKRYNELKSTYQVFIFKDIESLYDFKKNRKWVIFRNVEKYFMIITGFIENKENEKFQNMVLALEGSQYKSGRLVKIMNVPVASNEDRDYLFRNKNKVKNKVFEFKTSGQTDKAYKDAIFEKTRFDLVPEVCVFD